MFSLQSTNWENLIKVSELKKLVEFYKKKNVFIELLDLRFEIALKKQ